MIEDKRKLWNEEPFIIYKGQFYDGGVLCLNDE